MQSQTVALVVVAAGRGTRLGAERPKQYLPCAGRPLLAHTLEALAAAWPFSAVTVAIRADDRALYDEALAHLSPAARAAIGPPAIGGATRQQSVLAGLEALAPAATRPRAHPRRRTPLSFAAASSPARSKRPEAHGAAAPGTPLSDTVKQVDAEGKVLATPPRASLRAVQTPQAFRFPLILEAHRSAAARGVGDLTDDVAVAEWAGAPAFVFEGDPMNLKVTTMQDLARGGSAAQRRGRRDPGRPGFRRARLRAGRPCLAVRYPRASHAGAQRPFGRGRGAACARRRDLRRAGRRRHRRAFPAFRPAMEGRAVASVPRARGGARPRPRRRHRPSRRDADLRSAEDRPASRRHARPRRRDRRPRRSAASRSRRRRPSGSASPAGARGSPAWRRRRCGCREVEQWLLLP